MKRLFFLPALFLAGCTSQDQTAPVISQSPPVELVQTNSKTAPATPQKELQRIAGTPDGVQNELGLTLPRGFKIAVFAEGLKGPRRLAIAPGATAQKFDVFVSESYDNRVRVLRESNGDGRADQKWIWANGLNQPYGLAWIGDSFYVANTDSVVRFAFVTGQTQASDAPKQIIKLTRGGYNQHWTRNLLASQDQKKLFVTVGSSCNTCEEDDPQRAAISQMNPDGSAKRVFASGLRNPVGLAFQPGTNALWTAVNERDNLGDDIPPDYITSVKDGGFYGWPYAYTDTKRQIFPDPTFGAKNSQKVRNTIAPSVPVQAHSANLGIAFAQSPKFPKNYSGDAFLTFHGSWNRSEKTGYKIARVDFQNGKPVAISDFVSGFLKSNGEVWGRPVDIINAPDGSLLFSDDKGNKIWRVWYAG